MEDLYLNSQHVLLEAGQYLRPTDLPPKWPSGDGKAGHEVEQIENSWYFHGKLQYLVKWKGYPPSENQWFPDSTLKNSPDIVNQFHQTYPEVLRWINVVD
jgi:Chromo (CHRromatin Organisation MOdifier) domain